MEKYQLIYTRRNIKPPADETGFPFHYICN